MCPRGGPSAQAHPWQHRARGVAHTGREPAPTGSGHLTYSASDAALVRAVSVLVRRIGTGGDGNLLGFTRTSTHARWWAHLRVLCTRPRARCRLLRSHTAQAAARIASNLHFMTLRSAWSPHDGPWYRCGGRGGDHAKTRDHHTERSDARIAHFRELANLF